MDKTELREKVDDFLKNSYIKRKLLELVVTVEF